MWLLDVDGVLNAVTRRPDTAVWDDWAYGEARAAGSVWPIRWSRTVVRTITELYQSGRADVRWLTTWEDAANGDLRELLGLPELPVVARAREVAGAHRPTEGPLVSPAPVAPAGRARWWKLTAAQGVRELHDGRALVWTDDDLAFEADAHLWAEATVRRRLLLAPPTDTGLTPAMLRRIVAFCDDRP